MALPRQKILEYIKENKIISDNFSEKNLEPASYDFRLGIEGITSSIKKKINIEEEGYISIEPGEFVVVQSLEHFDIPLDIVGNIGMTSKYARKGLILLHGLQIDPGFKGPLHLRAFNTSTEKIIISYHETIGMVQFIQLIVPVKEGYKGKYQALEHIPPEDIEQIIRSEGMTMGNMIRSIQGLIISITGLKTTQEGIKNDFSRLREDWSMHEKRIERINILFSIILAAIVTIFGVIGIFT